VIDCEYDSCAQL